MPGDPGEYDHGWESEYWVGFDVPPDAVQVISGTAFPGRMHTNT